MHQPRTTARGNELQHHFRNMRRPAAVMLPATLGHRRVYLTGKVERLEALKVVGHHWDSLTRPY